MGWLTGRYRRSGVSWDTCHKSSQLTPGGDCHHTDPFEGLRGQQSAGDSARNPKFKSVIIIECLKENRFCRLHKRIDHGFKRFPTIFKKNLNVTPQPSPRFFLLCSHIATFGLCHSVNRRNVCTYGRIDIVRKQTRLRIEVAIDAILRRPAVDVEWLLRRLGRWRVFDLHVRNCVGSRLPRDVVLGAVGSQLWNGQQSMKAVSVNLKDA